MGGIGKVDNEEGRRKIWSQSTLPISSSIEEMQMALVTAQLVCRVCLLGRTSKCNFYILASKSLFEMPFLLLGEGCLQYLNVLILPKLVHYLVWCGLFNQQEQCGVSRLDGVAYFFDELFVHTHNFLHIDFSK